MKLVYNSNSCFFFYVSRHCNKLLANGLMNKFTHQINLMKFNNMMDLLVYSELNSPRVCLIYK